MQKARIESRTSAERMLALVIYGPRCLIRPSNRGLVSSYCQLIEKYSENVNYGQFEAQYNKIKRDMLNLQDREGRRFSTGEKFRYELRELLVTNGLSPEQSPQLSNDVVAFFRKREPFAGHQDGVLKPEAKSLFAWLRKHKEMTLPQHDRGPWSKISVTFVSNTAADHFPHLAARLALKYTPSNEIEETMDIDHYVDLGTDSETSGRKLSSDRLTQTHQKLMHERKRLFAMYSNKIDHRSIDFLCVSRNGAVLRRAAAVGFHTLLRTGDEWEKQAQRLQTPIFRWTPMNKFTGEISAISTECECTNSLDNVKHWRPKDLRASEPPLIRFTPDTEIDVAKAPLIRRV